MARGAHGPVAGCNQKIVRASGRGARGGCVHMVSHKNKSQAGFAALLTGNMAGVYAAYTEWLSVPQTLHRLAALGPAPAPASPVVLPLPVVATPLVDPSPPMADTPAPAPGHEEILEKIRKLLALP